MIHLPRCPRVAPGVLIAKTAIWGLVRPASGKNAKLRYEDDRWFGTRIKHRMKSNWLKMYDKFGLILRVETVINSPKEFWVYRTQPHRDGTSSVGYYPMTKSVASLVDYQEQALACNRRYLDALAVVDDPTPAYQDLRHLTEPKVVEGRSYAGFNLFCFSRKWRDAMSELYDNSGGVSPMRKPRKNHTP